MFDDQTKREGGMDSKNKSCHGLMNCDFQIVTKRDQGRH